MNAVDKILFYLKKYIVSILMIVFAISFLGIYMSTETVIYKGEEVVLQQNSLFLQGAIFFLIGSLLSVLFISGIISKMISYVLFVVLIGTSAYVIYKDYTSVKSQIDWIEEKKRRYIEIKQRMEDIRDAQLAYKDRYGKYAPSFDKLIQFIKEDYVVKVEREKPVPGGFLTREEMNKLGFPQSEVLKPFDDELAWKLAQFEEKRPELEGFRRDTIKIPVINALFTNDKAIAKRIEAPTDLEFEPDSLRYVPYAGNEFIMKTDSIDRGDGKASVFLVEDPIPYDEQDTLRLGSLTELKTNGNWSNR